MSARRYPRVVRTVEATGHCSACKLESGGPFVDVELSTLDQYGKHHFVRACIPCAKFLAKASKIALNKESRRTAPSGKITCKRFVLRPDSPYEQASKCFFAHPLAHNIPRVAFHGKNGMSVICDPCLAKVGEAAS